MLCPDGEAVVDAGPGAPTGANAIDLFEPSFGEVTGDGRLDAVIHVSCGSGGGNATGTSVIVVSSEPGGLGQVGQPIEGFAPVVIDGRLVVNRAVFAEGDARCCPSSPRSRRSCFGRGAGSTAAVVVRSTAVTPVSTSGMGTITIGRSYAGVAAGTGQPVEVADALGTDGACVYLTFPQGPPGVHGLGGDGLLRSLEVDDPTVRTTSGLGVGSTEADVVGAFPGRVDRAPHTYQPGGSYLTSTPVDTADCVVVFETDGATVTRYRTGEPAWATAPEGCA